jgi:hypothetical protein
MLAGSMAAAAAVPRSPCAVTGKPIKLMGTGESSTRWRFHPRGTVDPSPASEGSDSR